MTLPVKIGIAILILAACLPLGYKVTERIKQLDGFCVSCHLDEQTPLHKEKHGAFVKTKPVNLAGAHKSNSAKKFYCNDCHTGRSLPLKLELAYLEIYNTLKYLLGTAKEPEHLNVKLMPDENCNACHPHFVSSANSFHGLEQHRPPMPVQCIECHPAHPEGLEHYNFIVMDRLLKTCEKCHPGLSPTFKALIAGALKAPEQLSHAESGVGGWF